MAEVKTSENHLEVIDGSWLVSKSIKVTKMNISTVISHDQLLYGGCYLDGGQQMSEIQIVWEPGVEVNRIILSGTVSVMIVMEKKIFIYVQLV